MIVLYSINMLVENGDKMDKDLNELIERTKKNLFLSEMYKEYPNATDKRISYSELSMYDKSAGKKVLKAFVNHKKTYGYVFFFGADRKLNWSHGCFFDLGDGWISIS